MMLGDTTSAIEHGTMPPAPTKEKIIVLSLDYDDCLVRRQSIPTKAAPERGVCCDAFDPVDFDDVVNEHNPPQGLHQWQRCLLEKNDRLFRYIKHVVQKNKATRVIITCGSARQTAYMDALNACKHNLYSGSCYEALALVRDKLQAAIPDIPVTLDKMLLGDIFLGKEQGWMFDETTTWLAGQPYDKTIFASIPHDRTKIALHYAYLHHLALQYPQADMDYLALDDSYKANWDGQGNPCIINALNSVYTAHSQLIPANITFTTLPYQRGKLQHDAINVMQGTGSLDPHYKQTIHNMMVRSCDGADLRQQHRNFAIMKESLQCFNLFTDEEKTQTFLASRQQHLKVFPPARQLKHPLAYASHVMQAGNDSENAGEEKTAAGVRRAVALRAWAPQWKQLSYALAVSLMASLALIGALIIFMPNLLLPTTAVAVMVTLGPLVLSSIVLAVIVLAKPQPTRVQETAHTDNRTELINHVVAQQASATSSSLANAVSPLASLAKSVSCMKAPPSVLLGGDVAGTLTAQAAFPVTMP